jgi:competence protein ComEA
MFKYLIAGLLALCSALAMAAVDINKGDQAALESVKGIGPAMSGRLLEERKKSPFKDWPDLITRVKGIGEGNAAKFSEGGMTVNGESYKGVSPKPAEAKASDSKLAKAKPPKPQ